MEEQYNFDISLDFLDPSTTNVQQNTTTPEGYQQQAQGQQQLVYDVESLANRIASVNDLVVQLRSSKEENAKLQKQMQDLSDSAMSIRCMYEREKTEKAKYALLSKELQEKCDRAESQLTNKTLHFEQLTSKIEQSTEKGPIAYNELALRYQRLALQLEEDKLLNHKERNSLQQIQDYIETKKLTPLALFKKKLPVHAKKQSHDYAMQCDLKPEKKSQGTQSESAEPLKKATCTQGTQYTWYTTTRGTNTPSPVTPPQKEMKTKGTQYISSTTTRGTSTSAFIKQQSIGTNFPEVVPVSIEDIFKEMIFDGIPISPLPDSPKAMEEEEVVSIEKVQMKTVGTNTGLKNVRKPIDYVSLTIKHSDSRPPSRNIYDRVKNESPVMSMPTMNPFVGMGMTPLPLNCTLADTWNMLGQALFGNAALYPMHTNMPSERMRMNADMARRRERQQSRDERSNSSKDYFDEEVLRSPNDYLAPTRSIATSPISPRTLQSSDDYLPSEETNFFDRPYMHSIGSPSAFVPVVRLEGNNKKIVPNESVTDVKAKSKKSLQVDEILKLFPEYSHSLQKRNEIVKVLKISRKERKWQGSKIHRQVGGFIPNSTDQFVASESFQKTEIQSDFSQEQSATSSEDTDDSAQSTNSSEQLEESSKPVSEEVFLGFDDESQSEPSSHEVFCKPSIPLKRRPVLVPNNSDQQPMNIDGAPENDFESTGIANPLRQNDLQLQKGRPTDRRLDVRHNVSHSLSKKGKRKRQSSSLDTRRSSKMHKVDKTSSATEPLLHLKSALSLNQNVETQQHVPQDKIAPNSSLLDEITSNFNKTLTQTKCKQSNPTSGHQMEVSSDTGRQITDYSDLLSSNLDERCKFAPLTPEETGPGSNNRQGKSSATAIRCVFRSSTPEEGDCGFNERPNNPVSMERPNSHETDHDFNSKKEKLSGTNLNCKFSPSRPEGTHMNISDKQEKPLGNVIKCKFQSPTPVDTDLNQSEADCNSKERQNKPLNPMMLDELPTKRNTISLAYRPIEEETFLLKQKTLKHMESVSQAEATIAREENSTISIAQSEKPPVFKDQKTAEENSQIFAHHDQKKSNDIVIPNGVLDTDGMIADPNPNEFPARIYNQRTPQSPEQNMETTTKRLNNTNDTSFGKQQILPSTGTEYPPTIRSPASSSSDSELDLTIDCPKSPKRPDSCVPDMSSLLKTPPKANLSPSQVKAPNNVNGNYHSSPTENFEDFLLSENADTDKPEFQMFLTKILDEVATPLSPISVMAPSEKAIDSEAEGSCDEEASPTPASKGKRKTPTTAAIAVKRSARLKAKNKTHTDSLTNISLLNFPGVQLGKYTKKTDHRRPTKKPIEVEEQKTDKKVDIICDIPMGYFKDLMDEEMPSDSFTQISDTTTKSNQQVNQMTEEPSQPTAELSCEAMYLPKSKEVYQEPPTLPVESNIFEELESGEKIFGNEQTNACEENPSDSMFSFDDCPASPPPMDQKPEETHVIREIGESTSVMTNPTSNSLMSHIIANYNQHHHKMVTQSRQIDQKILAQLQSIINDFIDGLCLLMDTIRTVETLLNVSTSETTIAQALIGVVKTAPRAETEVNPIPELYLSQTLHKLLSLLEPLSSRLPNLRKQLQAGIEQSLFSFTKDTMPLEVVMNLTQFYLSIIAEPTATSNPARLFICKCLYFYNQKAIPMIYETLCVYPSVLPKREDPTYDRSDALINTIQCLLMSTFYDMDKTDLKSREMFTKLRKFYNYESNKPPRNEIIENLMAKIRAGRLKNVSYAFVLICKRMEQKMTEKLVLADLLLPLANEYYHTLSQTTENDEKVTCVLECISFIIKPFTVGTDISIYMNLFVRFLNACDRQTIQEAALAAILRTIRFGYVHCFNTIYNFKPNFELASSTKAMLKSFVYKKNLEFLKRLEHQAHVLVTN